MKRALTAFRLTAGMTLPLAAETPPQPGELMVRSARYVRVYRKDTPERCKRAFAHFGESGTTIPGLIARASPAP